MSLKLLDVANRPDLLLAYPCDEDRVWLLAFVAMCRTRMERAASRHAEPQAAARGGRIAALSVSDLLIENADGEVTPASAIAADGYLTFTGTELDRRLGHRIAGLIERSRNASRRALMEPLGRVTPDAPLSAEARALIEAWARQFESYRGRPIRRCQHARCAIDGGRYFIAKKNDRDCPYCRRGTSRRTRSRHRQR